MNNKAKIIGRILGSCIVFAIWFFLAYQAGKQFDLTTNQNIALSLLTATFFNVLNEIRVTLSDILKALE